MLRARKQDEMPKYGDNYGGKTENVKLRNLQGLEKVQGYRGILLVKRGSFSKDKQALVNKYIKFATSIFKGTIFKGKKYSMHLVD